VVARQPHAQVAAAGEAQVGERFEQAHLRVTGAHAVGHIV